MKKCPYCAEEIQEEAVLCRHCTRELPKHKSFKPSKTSPAAWGCLTLLVLGVIIVIAAGSSGGDSKKSNTASTEEKPAKSAILSVGEEGIINNNDDPSDCHGGTLVASSKDAFDKLTEASVANDKAGLNELIGAGQVFLADNCSRVLMVDYDGFLAAVAKLRFIDSNSPLYNQTGFVASEFATKQ